MISKDNPCFGCRVVENGREKQSPCCHDSTLLVNQEEYLRLFLQSFLARKVEVEETLRGDSMFFYIYLLGVCPHLTDGGLCFVEAKKPLGCKNAVPGKFGFCWRK